MSLPDQRGPAAETARWKWQFFVVVGLLVGFAALVVAMLILAGGSDTEWQRRVYLFSAVEAIVFTAIGWLFGREVHRAEAESAKRDSHQAKQETAIAREVAARSAAEARSAIVAVTEEKTKGRAVQALIHASAGSWRSNSPRDIALHDQQADPSITLAVLRSAVDEIYGQQP